MSIVNGSKRPEADDSKHNDNPPTLISKLRGLSGSRPSSPDPRISGSIAAGRSIRSNSQTQSLSTSPHTLKDFKPPNAGSIYTNSNPPSSSSSPRILPVDRSKGWQPPTRVIQAKPSVELFMPTARFTSSCLSPKKGPQITTREDGQFTADDAVSEFKEISDTGSIASFHLSRYTQTFKTESIQNNSEEESTVVDSNASSVTPQNVLNEDPDLDALKKIKQEPEKEIALNLPQNIQESEAINDSLKNQEIIPPKQATPNNRSSWWSFSSSPAIESKKDPIEQPESIQQKIENSKPVVSKKFIPEEISSKKTPPVSPWWATFGFGSSSALDANISNHSDTQDIRSDADKNAEAQEENCEVSHEVNESQLVISEYPEPQTLPHTNPSPYPGSEPSYIVRTIHTMSPTWKYFFSKKKTSLQNPDPKLINDSKDVFSSEVVLQSQMPQDTPNTSTAPSHKDAARLSIQDKPAVKLLTHPNLVLPVLDVVSLSSGLSPPLVLRYALDTISYYTGYQFSEQTNQYSSTFFPPSINKVVIIGVHGWYPLKIYQKMIGEPTGTSEKFCSSMTNALQTYLLDHYGLVLPEESITQIPLSCEGKIEARLNKLYSRLLSNPSWMAALCEADNILIAAHSQGTPVSLMLLNRLIRDGLLDPAKQRTSVLAMAGVTHGPFAFLKENYIVKYFEAEAARELFEFMNPSASIVKQYNESMQRVVESGVHVCAIASLTDQVVPLYSGVMHGFTHPGILRALYIDGVDYTPDFLTSLIVFALLLRNHGHSDHDLIMHLSNMVAGSLYSGTPGHSTIYEERKVYTTAIQWHFAKESLSAKLKVSPLDAHIPLNPYFLPWIMRGLLEDANIRQNIYLYREMEDLRTQFVHWQPLTKQLKELQFRLEPIRAQLIPEESDTS